MVQLRPLPQAPLDLGAFLESVRATLPLLEATAAEADASGVIAPAAIDMLMRCGLIAAPLPVINGGVDLTSTYHHTALFDVLRLLGSTDLSLARIYEGHVNAIALTVRYGSAAQVEQLAQAVRDGALSAVWGADDDKKLRLEHAFGGLRLHGRKVFASGAGLVTRPLVTASTPDGPVLVLLDLVPHERADATGWTAQGMRSTLTGIMDLDGLAVHADQVIGQPGDFLRQPHFSGGAWRFCAAHLGAAEKLVDLFREHLVSRKRDSDPFQMQRVAQCAVAVGTASFWIRDAARRLGASSDAEATDIVAFANLTRMVTERAALDVLEAVHRGAGLPSFLRPHPIERIGRDLATYLRQPVPDLAMADAGRAVLAAARSTGDLWTAA